MSIKAWDVRECNKVQGALEEAFAYDGPALVAVHTDPDALAMPPDVTFEQVKGFATTMGKLILNGRAAEMVDTAKSDMKYLRELL